MLASKSVQVRHLKDQRRIGVHGRGRGRSAVVADVERHLQCITGFQGKRLERQAENRPARLRGDAPGGKRQTSIRPSRFSAAGEGRRRNGQAGTDRMIVRLGHHVLVVGLTYAGGRLPGQPDAAQGVIVGRFVVDVGRTGRQHDRGLGRGHDARRQVGFDA